MDICETTRLAIAARSNALLRILVPQKHASESAGAISVFPRAPKAARSVKTLVSISVDQKSIAEVAKTPAKTSKLASPGSALIHPSARGLTAIVLRGGTPVMACVWILRPMFSIVAPAAARVMQARNASTAPASVRQESSFAERLASIL